MRNGATDAESFTLDIAVATDCGNRRVSNDDRCGQHRGSPTHAIVAVADGKAESEGAAAASERAIEALMEAYKSLPAGTTLTQRMMRAARNASFATYDLAVVVPQLRGVSASLTAAAVAAGQMTAAHVGNGRLYLMRDGTATQLSKDHTVAAEAIAEGRDYPAAQADQLTRSLGRELLVPVDIFEMELKAGDAILVCTDGLHAVLSDGEIARHLATGDAAAACGGLVDEAKRQGAPDNVSVGVLRVGAAVR